MAPAIQMCIRDRLSVKRSYPNLAEQDTQYIPKSIEDGGKNLTLSDIQWQTDKMCIRDRPAPFPKSGGQ